MAAICSDRVGNTHIGIHARRSGERCRYYIAVSHDAAPNVTAIRLVAENQEQALRRFEVARENALASSRWWAGS